MYKKGDIVQVLEEYRHEYSVTTPEATLEVMYYREGDDYIRVKVIAHVGYNQRFIGDDFAIEVRTIKQIGSVFGPELPPLLQKIKLIHARQKDKGILRY